MFRLVVSKISAFWAVSLMVVVYSFRGQTQIQDVECWDKRKIEPFCEQINITKS